MKKVIIISSGILLLLVTLAILIYIVTYEEITISRIYEAFTQEEYMKKADLVIAVKVLKNVETKYTNLDFTIMSSLNKDEPARNELVTYSLVKITDVIKGDVKVNDEILIREFGGKYKNVKTIVDNSEVVQKNEELVVFLFKDTSDIADNTKEYYVLANPYRTKFKQDKSINKYVNVIDENIKMSIEDFKTIYTNNI